MIDSDSGENNAGKTDAHSAGKPSLRKTGRKGKKNGRSADAQNDQNSIDNLDIHGGKLHHHGVDDDDDGTRKDPEPTIPMMIDGQQVEVPAKAFDPDYRMSVREAMDHADLCVGRIMVSKGDHLSVDGLGVPAGVVMSGDCCAHGVYVCVSVYAFCVCVCEFCVCV